MVYVAELKKKDKLMFKIYWLRLVDAIPLFYIYRLLTTIKPKY